MSGSPATDTVLTEYAGPYDEPLLKPPYRDLDHFEVFHFLAPEAPIITTVQGTARPPMAADIELFARPANESERQALRHHVGHHGWMGCWRLLGAPLRMSERITIVAFHEGPQQPSPIDFRTAVRIGECEAEVHGALVVPEDTRQLLETFLGSIVAPLEATYARLAPGRLNGQLDAIERERANARAAYENGVRLRHAAIDRLRRTMLRTRSGPEREAMQAEIAAIAAEGPAAEAATTEFDRVCRDRIDRLHEQATANAEIRATPLFFARWHLNAHPAGTLRRP